MNRPRWPLCNWTSTSMISVLGITACTYVTVVEQPDATSGDAASDSPHDAASTMDAGDVHQPPTEAGIDAVTYSKSDACVLNPPNEPSTPCDGSETYAEYLCPSGTEPTVQEQVWEPYDAAGYYPGYICCFTFPYDAGSGVWWCCTEQPPNNDPYPCQ